MDTAARPEKPSILFVYESAKALLRLEF